MALMQYLEEEILFLLSLVFRDEGEEGSCPESPFLPHAIYMFICTLSTNGCMFVFVCMYVCMHACMYACMHVCVYACMHVFMYKSPFKYLSQLVKILPNIQFFA